MSVGLQVFSNHCYIYMSVGLQVFGNYCLCLWIYKSLAIIVIYVCGFTSLWQSLSYMFVGLLKSLAIIVIYVCGFTSLWQLLLYMSVGLHVFGNHCYIYVCGFKSLWLYCYRTEIFYTANIMNSYIMIYNY